MKRLCSTLPCLGLSGTTSHFIIRDCEGGVGGERYVQFETIPNHALERSSFLRANRRNGRGGTKSADRAMPHLLAAGFRAHLPPRTLSDRCAGFNPGLLCYAT